MTDNQELTERIEAVDLFAQEAYLWHGQSNSKESGQTLNITMVHFLEMANLIKDVSKQLTTTQQALDTAVEALKDIRVYALAMEQDGKFTATREQMITRIKSLTQMALKSARSE